MVCGVPYKKEALPGELGTSNYNKERDLETSWDMESAVNCGQ